MQRDLKESINNLYGYEDGNVRKDLFLEIKDYEINTPYLKILWIGRDYAEFTYKDVRLYTRIEKILGKTEIVEIYYKGIRIDFTLCLRDRKVDKILDSADMAVKFLNMKRDLVDKKHLISFEGGIGYGLLMSYKDHDHEERYFITREGVYSKKNGELVADYKPLGVLSETV